MVKMTQDQFLIHLFGESADQTMSKIAMEILSGAIPTVAALRTKVAETENSLWYNAGRNLGKFAGGQAPPTGARFCKPCNSNTHWEYLGWGVCVAIRLSGAMLRRILFNP